MVKRLIPLLGILVIIFGGTVTQSFAHGGVDQSQITFNDGFPTPDMASQSFTPTWDNLIGVDLSFMANPGGCLCIQFYKLEIIKDTLGGAVVGTSETKFISVLAGKTKVVHFDFPNKVSLIPDATYFIKVISASTTDDIGLSLKDSNVYPGGSFYEDNGMEDPNADLFFRTYFDPPVGGTVLSPDIASLLLLEAQSSAIWWLPAVVLAGAGVALFTIRKKI